VRLGRNTRGHGFFCRFGGAGGADRELGTNSRMEHGANPRAEPKTKPSTGGRKFQLFQTTPRRGNQRRDTQDGCKGQLGGGGGKNFPPSKPKKKKNKLTTNWRSFQGDAGGGKHPKKNPHGYESWGGAISPGKGPRSLAEKNGLAATEFEDTPRGTEPGPTPTDRAARGNRSSGLRVFGLL